MTIPRNEPKPAIVPVLLCGGTGTRLWPLSRDSYPKQFIAMRGELSLFQQTALRISDRRLYRRPIVVVNEDHRFIAVDQLREIDVSPATLVVEPVGRNTAPAAAVAALHASEQDGDAKLLLLPADHVIDDEAAFTAAVASGLEAAGSGRIVLFGIEPNSAATGYGYIRQDQPSGAAASGVAEFVEKPAAATAERYFASGDYLWNSGIVLVAARQLLAELERHAPDVVNAARAALVDGERDLDFLRLGAEAFGRAPSISIDHSVLEKSEHASVIRVRCGWTDLGAWSALWEIGDRDAAGNVMAGQAVCDDSHNCYLRGEGILVAAVGVEDMIVVATEDVVLVTRKDSDQNIKRLVERLKRERHASAFTSRRVHRPWGYYESIQQGPRYQVKRITVKPGGKLSLQKHFHRAEHWVVVSGTAIVTRDAETLLVRENESIYLPLGSVHRLENPGKLDLDLIEVQSGGYLAEDDIVRIEDVYDRV
ncbi:mannose-1-phosphate guanylyltransferase/mannose-6-phosphate isomerase [Rhodoplanes roseus]|uniref:mannose-1-phosphate guanylyltransferase n=1 Tax=Rhodoplanes roseus TaxID=29409 RepID=A0A327KWK1_9BRAD|nr:mannose-1-phosphate guanylyltransferase/mannose-6-phosphate isomerase [Rhodoplanes roseus]RAI42394.1 mannose-1-phosphate guanylyltransferase/mannose-6-phosphate isomerase [Rhodoplanes roseus]